MEILRRDDRVEAIILRARREVLERFGQEQMINTMSDLYRRLAARKRERSAPGEAFRVSQYLPLAILAFLAAFIATPLVGKLAARTGFVDKPQPHKMHVRPMPLLGGLAIYLALCVVLVIALFRVNFSSEISEIAAIAVGTTMLMLVGLWDDRRGVAPHVKLLAQIGAGLIAAVAGVRVVLFPWPLVNYAITLFWFVGISNAINLMDNMDGLAAGTSAVSALFFTILAASAGQGLVASLAVAVTGASLGFLYYNISPAMIFMGDTGSLLLGFLLAVIGIKFPTLPSARVHLDGSDCRARAAGVRHHPGHVFAAARPAAGFPGRNRPHFAPAGPAGIGHQPGGAHDVHSRRRAGNTGRIHHPIHARDRDHSLHRAAGGGRRRVAGPGASASDTIHQSDGGHPSGGRSGARGDPRGAGVIVPTRGGGLAAVGIRPCCAPTCRSWPWRRKHFPGG